jgi:hypothetical protein
MLQSFHLKHLGFPTLWRWLCPVGLYLFWWLKQRFWTWPILKQQWRVNRYSWNATNAKAQLPPRQNFKSVSVWESTSMCQRIMWKYNHN